MTPAELADYLDVPLSTVYEWNSTGTGPRRLRFGKRVRYRVDDIAAWIASCEVA